MHQFSSSWLHWYALSNIHWEPKNWQVACTNCITSSSLQVKWVEKEKFHSFFPPQLLKSAKWVKCRVQVKQHKKFFFELSLSPLLFLVCEKSHPKQAKTAKRYEMTKREKYLIFSFYNIFVCCLERIGLSNSCNRSWGLAGESRHSFLTYSFDKLFFIINIIIIDFVSRWYVECLNIHTSESTE